MLDRYTGNVFSVGRGVNTQGMSPEEYMKTMGGVNSAVDWKPVAPEEGIQTGTDATEEYLNQIQALNNLGMKLAAEGIDPLRHDPRNPRSTPAVRQFQDQLSKVQRSAAGLKAGQKVAEKYTEFRLKDNVVGAGFGKNNGGVATTEDLNNLMNINPFVKALDGIATETNSNFAKSYNTELEAQDANMSIEAAKRKVDMMRPELIKNGFSDEMATMIILATRAKIGKATYDPLALREQEDKEKTSASVRAKNYAAAKKDKSDSSKTGYYDLADKVASLNKGQGLTGKVKDGFSTAGDYSSWDDLFYGQEIGESGYVVASVKFDKDEDQAKVYIVPKDGDEGVDLTSYPPESIESIGGVVSRPLNNSFIRDMLGDKEYAKYLDAVQDRVDNHGNVRTGANKQGRQINHARVKKAIEAFREKHGEPTPEQRAAIEKKYG